MKTVAQFAKWLNDQFDAEYPDTAEAVRHALRLGAGSVTPPAITDKRSALDYIGRLLAWCREKADADYLIDVRQAAARLGCSERKLHDMKKAGEIPVVRIGRRVLFSSHALDRWIYAIST